MKHFLWCNCHHLLMALYKKKSVKSVKVYKFKGYIIMNCKFSLHSVNNQWYHWLPLFIHLLAHCMRCLISEVILKRHRGRPQGNGSFPGDTHTQMYAAMRTQILVVLCLFLQNYLPFQSIFVTALDQVIQWFSPFPLQ